jgi:SAM-dependent methyltransferase
VGVDLSQVAIEKARQRYRHVEFIAADIMNWDCPRDSFDLVVSHEVLEHIEQQEAYLEKAHGLLKQGGFLILTTPNKRTCDAMPGQSMIGSQLQPIEKWLYPAQLERLLSSRFEVARTTIVVPGRAASGMHRFVCAPLLRAILWRLHVGWIYDAIILDLGFGLHFLVVAQKQRFPDPTTT